MINKESKETKKDLPTATKPDETAVVDVLAHIVIKDTTTGEVIVNKRG